MERQNRGKSPREKRSFLAIDFETANTQTDSACSIGLVRVTGGRIVREEVYLIRPPTRHFQFTYIHGLTWDHVKDAPHFGTLWPKLASWFEDVDFVAAHNASFDLRVLKGCCLRYGIEMPELPFHCTVQIARDTWSVYPTRLPDVCRHLGIELKHHEALSDARACAQIVIESKFAVQVQPRLV